MRAKVGVKPLQGGKEVGEEPRGLIVLGLKREPGNGRARGCPPLGQQGRFAKTGWRGDKRKRASHSLLESLHEVRARDKLRARTGQVQPGCEKRDWRIPLRVGQN